MFCFDFHFRTVTESQQNGMLGESEENLWSLFYFQLLHQPFLVECVKRFTFRIYFHWTIDHLLRNFFQNKKKTSSDEIDIYLEKDIGPETK